MVPRPAGEHAGGFPDTRGTLWVARRRVQGRRRGSGGAVRRYRFPAVGALGGLIRVQLARRLGQRARAARRHRRVSGADAAVRQDGDRAGRAGDALGAGDLGRARAGVLLAALRAGELPAPTAAAAAVFRSHGGDLLRGPEHADVLGDAACAGPATPASCSRGRPVITLALSALLGRAAAEPAGGARDRGRVCGRGAGGGDAARGGAARGGGLGGDGRCCIPVSLAIGNIYQTVDWPEDTGPIALAAGSHLAAARHAVRGVGGDRRRRTHAAARRHAVAGAGAGGGGLGMFVFFFRLQAVGAPVYLSQIGYVAAAVGLLARRRVPGRALRAWRPGRAAAIVRCWRSR